MDAVLGLSMTPTSVGMVLVEGNDADGVTVERDAFEVLNSEDATAAVLRSESLAATRGLRLKSIGVTWSEDAGREASMLMRILSESGFDNIVPVALPEATEALARGIADALGFRTTAVCTIEPDRVITLIVHSMDTADGAVHTAFNCAIDSDESLISWLSTVFTRADWQPEALAVVGSAGDFAEVLPLLQDALSVPVFSPDEAELALARGAAMASAQTAEFALPEPYHFGHVLGSGYWGDDRRVLGLESSGRHARHVRPKKWSGSTLPLAMLVTGSVAFVVSVSAAVSMQFIPDRHIRTVPAAAAVPVVQQVPAPPPIVVPPVAPALVVVTPEPSEAPSPAVEQAPTVDQMPPAAPEGQANAVPADAAAAPAALPAAVPSAADAPPPAPDATVPDPATTAEPAPKTLRSRIMDRLHGVTEPAPVDAPPPADAPPSP
ncbi:hypothetical protein [Mycobacterium sp. MAA66]|uniref:DUF7159 family protein n=1 Tax=Mycobacterium sp. MAA66 TaxID=3156297 RepID=UPI003517C8C4